MAGPEFKIQFGIRANTSHLRQDMLGAKNLLDRNITDPLRMASIEAMRSRLALSGLGSVMGGMRSVAGSLLGPLGSLAGLAGIGLSIGALSAGIKSLVTDSTELAGQIVDVSAKLGASTDAFQRWRYAAVATGVGAEGFTKSTEKLSKNLGDLNAKTGGFYNYLKTAGPEFAKSLAGKDTMTAMDMILSRANAISDVQQRTVFLQAAFGKSGKDMALLAKTDRDELNQLISSAPVISDANLQKLDALGDQTDMLGVKWSAFKANLASEMAPSLVKIVDQISKSFDGPAGKELSNSLRELSISLADVDWANAIKAISDLASVLTKLLGPLASLVGGISGKVIEGYKNLFGWGDEFYHRPGKALSYIFGESAKSNIRTLDRLPAVLNPLTSVRALAGINQSLLDSALGAGDIYAPEGRRNLLTRRLGSERDIDRGYAAPALPRIVQSGAAVSSPFSVLSAATAKVDGKIVVEVQAAKGTEAEVLRTESRGYGPRISTADVGRRR